MGIERVVHFQSGTSPGWPEIAAILVESGESPVLRMIDGLPAFPDEIPEPDWKELRVGLTGGMVTLRRDADTVRCVVWGGDEPSIQALKACTQALARTVGLPNDPIA